MSSQVEVPALPLTGERTVPDLPVENYWISATERRFGTR